LGNISLPAVVKIRALLHDRNSVFDKDVVEEQTRNYSVGDNVCVGLQEATMSSIVVAERVLTSIREFDP
jgi:PIN domain nuclease of toxin-antitoxin system